MSKILQILMLLKILGVCIAYERECPAVCTCSNTLTVVDCRDRSLNEIPHMPFNAGIVRLTNNRLTTLPEDGFSHLHRLIQLYLNRNLIRRVESRAFRGLGSLKYLNLDHNWIKVIGEDALRDLTSIEDITLMNNLLESIPPFSVTPLYNLKTIFLDNNNLSSAQFCMGNTSNMLEQINMISLMNNNIRSIKVDDFKCINMGELQELKLSDCRLTYIERDALKFKKLKVLQIKFNEDLGWENLQNIFTSISKNNIPIKLDIGGSLPSDMEILNGTFLKTLSSSVTELDICCAHNVQYIEGNTFSNFSNLRILRLSSLTRLSDIRDSMSECKELTELDFSGNTKLGIPSISLLSPPKLASLIIRGCGLIYLDVKLFKNKMNLKYIDISDSRIKGLHADIFSNLAFLTKLDLSHNSIHIINSNFTNNSGLKILRLNNNRLGRIQPDVFAGLKGLEQLHLNDNFLNKIPSRSFSNLMSLKKFNLAGNYLEDLKPLSNLTNLEMLILDRCHLDDIPVDSFEGLHNIKVLRLSRNNLNTLIKINLSYFPKLQLIDLSHNKISSIDPQGSELITSNKVSIDLSSNPFECFCSLRSFRFWLHSKSKAEISIKFPNFKSYRCNTPENMRSRRLLSFDPNKIWADCHIFYLLTGSCLIIALLIVVVVVVYIFRWNIRLCFYTIKKKIQERRKEKLLKKFIKNYRAIPVVDNYEQLDYDVTICHSKARRDEDWVMNVLLPRIDIRAEERPVSHHAHFINIESSEHETIIQHDNLDLQDNHLNFQNATLRPAFDLGRVFVAKRNMMPSMNVIYTMFDVVDNARLVVICVSNDFLKDNMQKTLASLAVSTHCEAGRDTDVLLLFLDEGVDVKVHSFLRVFVKEGLYYSWEENSAMQKTFWEKLELKLTSISKKWKYC